MALVGIARADENITRTSFGFGQGGKCVYRREMEYPRKSFAFFFLIHFMEADQL